MPWSHHLPGVFVLTVENGQIQLVMERSAPLRQFEALQLASALTAASHELAYRHAFGQERDRETEASTRLSQVTRT